MTCPDIEGALARVRAAVHSRIHPLACIFADQPKEPTMTRTPMPPLLFIVVRDHGALGIGCSDPTSSRDAAYDDFTCATDQGDLVAVWQIATSGGVPVSVTDATDSFERELQEVCIARDLDWPTIRRLEDNPALKLAAE